MKKYILFLMVLLMVGFVSSEVNDYAPIKQNECALLRQVCASCSFVNISLAYPNSTLALSNVGMVDSGGGVWTYDFCNTTELGRYDVVGIGDINGADAAFVLFFDVSPSGSMLDSASSTTLFGSLLVMLIISVMFLIMAMKTDKIVAKIALYCISGIGFMMVILYTVVTIQQVLFGFDSIVNSVETLWVVTKIGITIAGIALGIVVFLIMLKGMEN